MLKKIFIKSMLLLQFLLIISCKVNLGKIEKPGDQGEKEVLIQSVVLKPSKTTVEPGESIDVFASITPENAGNKYLNWTIKPVSNTDAIIQKSNLSLDVISVSSNKPVECIVQAEGIGNNEGIVSNELKIRFANKAIINFLDPFIPDSSDLGYHVICNNTQDYFVGNKLYVTDFPAAPDKSGFIFSGWYSDVSFSEDSRIVSSIELKEQNNIYAKYVASDSKVTVKFSVNTDETGITYPSGYTAEVNATVGSQFELPELEKEGYTFGGWYLDKECNTDSFVDSPYTVTDNVTLYAKWTEETQYIKVESITLSTTDLNLKVGGQETLSAVILPETATDKTLIWDSSDTSVVSLTKLDNTNYKIIAAGTGSAEITVSSVDSGVKQICKVTVTEETSNIPVVSVALNAPSLNLNINDNYQLLPVFDPVNATNQNVTWKSSDVSVASVSSQGVVTAHGAGQADITVTTEDGRKTAVCKVVVNPVADVNGIILHAYEYVNAYIWESGNDAFDQKHIEMNREGESSWYTCSLEGIESANIIFTKKVGAWDSQTGNLSRSKGEWWYKNGTWYEYNPDDTVPPVLSSFTVDGGDIKTGNIIFTFTASDNGSLSNAKLYIDGNLIATISLTGTSATQNYSWDSGFIANGSHTVTLTVFDESGNSSETMTISITTENENKIPFAVINGAKKAKPGEVKTFAGTSSYDLNGTVDAYLWSVTGGTIQGANNLETVQVKMPDTNGTTVTVSLTVYDNEGASSTPTTVQVEISDSVVDFREETIYFLMTTRFYDGDTGNNVHCWDDTTAGNPDTDPAWRGDFQGIIDKLDYIKALGFSAIWITPPVKNASGYDYHGYHAINFEEIDPRYRTATETAEQSYQKLIDACHAKGIKVIQDIVLNHSGNWGEENIYPLFTRTDYEYKGSVSSEEVDGDTGVMKINWDFAQGRLPDNYESMLPNLQYSDGRIPAMKDDDKDTGNIYHHCKTLSWNGIECQTGQIAGDCVDLNTENPEVIQYLIDSYNKYIDMGVDGFRIDTVKHINRLMFNEYFIPAFKERGGEEFFIFGETCARYRGRWNEGVPSLSPSFYTWKETQSWATGSLTANVNSTNTHFATYASGFEPPVTGIPNHNLDGNNYHSPDWSMRSGLEQIDFPMHWAFNSALDAFNTCLNYDSDFNDATWNVTYVDSHDYAPDGAPENQRFAGYWPDKLNLIFTFRGIPCIYYGSEIEFMKGAPIDVGPNAPLSSTGRAYFGDYLEGSVVATDYGTYTASGTVAETLNHELAQHIIRLNQIRRAIPALQKGQYSREDCSGEISFKRRYTDSDVDSFALVTINGQGTFSNLPGGEYIEVITGATVSVPEGGSITSDSIGQGNMRVYVLKTSSCDITGKIGKDGTYLK